MKNQSRLIKSVYYHREISQVKDHLKDTYVAEDPQDGGKIVGCIRVNLMEDGKVAEVGPFAVAPGCQVKQTFVLIGQRICSHSRAAELAGD